MNQNEKASQDETPSPASGADFTQPTSQRRGRRRRRWKSWLWPVVGILSAVLAAGLYTHALLRGPVAKPIRPLDPNAPTLEEMPPTIRGIANDDDDAVRRKLLSKHAPSPTLTGIARHEASEMGKPAGPAYQGQGENLPLTSEELEPDSAIVQEAVKALQTYRQAASWKAKLPLIYNASLLEPHLKLHYDDRHETDPEPLDLAGGTLISAGDSKVVLLRYRSPSRPDSVLPAYFHRSPAGPLMLDWEAWTGFSEVTIPALKKTRQVIPTLLRVVAMESDYYNYEFDDKARFLAVKLRSPDGMHSLTGYVLRKSQLGIAVGNLIGVRLPNPLPPEVPLPPLRLPGAKQAVTLRVGFPPAAQSDHCVMVKEIVADRWMLFPGEGG
jgi:hypothetical protein